MPRRRELARRLHRWFSGVRLPPAALANLMKPENHEQLVKLVSFHIVPSRLLAKDMDGKMFKVRTVIGKEVEVDADDPGEGIRINKAKVVAVTDSPISAVGQVADVVLLAASAGMGMQNSLVAPMAVANALLNGVAAVKGTSALERYSRHDRLMNRWDSFLLKLDGTD